MTIDAFFVYGTLKRGECRSQCWPCRPQSVQRAWTHGTLFSRSDYPALVSGHDPVLGELWRFALGDVAAVIQVIDAIEGTGQTDEEDLYTREIVTVFGVDGGQLGRAYTYCYAADPKQDGFVQVRRPPWEWPACLSRDHSA